MPGSRLEFQLLQQAADHLGINTWTLANWEKGYTNPALRFWPEIIEFLGYDPMPEPKPSDLAQRIQWARRRRGLSLRELAKQLGVDPDTLRRWERGIIIPRGKHLALVQWFLGALETGGLVLRTDKAKSPTISTRTNIENRQPWRAWLTRTLRVAHAVANDMVEGQLGLRAMSLVYTTLLSLVPLLAVSFSVLKGFGVHNPRGT